MKRNELTYNVYCMHWALHSHIHHYWVLYIRTISFSLCPFFTRLQREQSKTNNNDDSNSNTCQAKNKTSINSKLCSSCDKLFRFSSITHNCFVFHFLYTSVILFVATSIHRYRMTFFQGGKSLSWLTFLKSDEKIKRIQQLPFLAIIFIKIHS